MYPEIAFDMRKLSTEQQINSLSTTALTNCKIYGRNCRPFRGNFHVSRGYWILAWKTI